MIDNLFIIDLRTLGFLLGGEIPGSGTAGLYDSSIANFVGSLYTNLQCLNKFTFLPIVCKGFCSLAFAVCFLDGSHLASGKIEFHFGLILHFSDV